MSILVHYLLELVLVAGLGVVAHATLRGPARLRWCEKVLNSRKAVVVAATLAGGTTWYVWGSLTDVGSLHDEASYLLQAKLFAQGRWTAPRPPIPAFFEQFHVFVDPVIASKYPPGHSLLLAPGVWLGLPGLMPMLLVAASGALVFALARRLTNPWVGVLTLLLWILGRTSLQFHSSYLSENTTELCWLGGFWALLDYRDRRRASSLCVLAACIAWGLITRPLTMIAYAVPCAVAVLWMMGRHRAWRTLVPALAVGAAIVGLLLVSNSRITGSWKTMAWNLYAREYMPWDIPGFGVDNTPPRRALPPDMAELSRQFAVVHEEHTPDALPTQAWRRISQLADADLGSWKQPDVRTLLVPFALIGLLLLALGSPVPGGRIALACAVALLTAYLSYAHPPQWTVYYLECSALVPFATSLGLWTLATIVTRRTRTIDATVLRDHAWLAVSASAAMIGAILLYAPSRVASAKGYLSFTHQSQREWRALLARRIPATQRAIVFVRYSPRHSPHRSLISNNPDLARAPVWIVYDRGPENARLLGLAPDRAAYLYDEATQTLLSLRTLAAGRP